MYTWSIAHATALQLSPVHLLETAASLGVPEVGIRLEQLTDNEPHFELIGNPANISRVQRVMQSTGVSIRDTEVVRLTPGFEIDAYRGFLETTAELGARSVTVQTPDPNRGRAKEHLRRFAEAAAQYNLRCELEFVSWTEVPDLHTAADIVTAVDMSNVGILVDVLHFVRSASSYEELRSLPPEWFAMAHLNDGPSLAPTGVERLVHAARHNRCIPFSGDFHIADILACLPEDITLTVEVPNDSALDELGAEQYVKRVMTRSQSGLKTILEGAS
ncbi:sugar phosphate isomerase/epimerase family protein [Corynebacterium glyciniphilum]|uniref:sugar phosphate isomerase/epimerase family protein n=1 Tax=Corynebacterium glyciniphilum TaxID=1404244 RepID=UPI001642D9A1|nr:TIM barrel protein [Corynebacterium glyciniphilum]